MSPVVTESGDCFAVGAEVCIMTDCTLIACSSNVLLFGFGRAERPIAIDAKVNFLIGVKVSNLLEESGKTMAGMDLMCAENTDRAIIPVRAAQTLVADTKNVLDVSEQEMHVESPRMAYLVTAIADRCMSETTPCLTH